MVVFAEKFQEMFLKLVGSKKFWLAVIAITAQVAVTLGWEFDPAAVAVIHKWLFALLAFFGAQDVAAASKSGTKS